MKITAVVNTYNEEKNISLCLKSINDYVDEIVVVDMHSLDKTVQIAKNFTRKIFYHDYIGYVEPARNFAIRKAGGNWIFLIDADERMTPELGLKIRRLADHSTYDYYRIPRKNIIFNKWIRYSGWWPDYQIRLFKKDKVSWGDEIHSIPITEGKGMDLPDEEKNALIHYNYNTVDQYISRMNRYTAIEADARFSSGYTFDYKNLLKKPISEFISRFYAWEGYRDGLHGLVLSVLQAISFFIVEIKCWEKSAFREENSDINREFTEKLKESNQDIRYWIKKTNQGKSGNIIKFLAQIKSKIKH